MSPTFITIRLLSHLLDIFSNLLNLGEAMGLTQIFSKVVQYIISKKDKFLGKKHSMVNNGPNKYLT